MLRSDITGHESMLRSDIAGWHRLAPVSTGFVRVRETSSLALNPESGREFRQKQKKTSSTKCISSHLKSVKSERMRCIRRGVLFFM